MVPSPRCVPACNVFSQLFYLREETADDANDARLLRVYSLVARVRTCVDVVLSCAERTSGLK